MGFWDITKRHLGAYAPDYLYAQPVGAIEKRHGRHDLPHDGILLFERTVQILALITVAAIAAVLIVGCGPIDAEVTAAHVAAADDRKSNVGPEDRAAVIHLSHPVAVATIRDCSPSGLRCTEWRSYVPRVKP